MTPHTARFRRNSPFAAYARSYAFSQAPAKAWSQLQGYMELESQLLFLMVILSDSAKDLWQRDA